MCMYEKEVFVCDFGGRVDGDGNPLGAPQCLGTRERDMNWELCEWVEYPEHGCDIFINRRSHGLCQPCYLMELARAVPARPWDNFRLETWKNIPIGTLAHLGSFAIHRSSADGGCVEIRDREAYTIDGEVWTHYEPRVYRREDWGLIGFVGMG